MPEMGKPVYKPRILTSWLVGGYVSAGVIGGAGRAWLSRIDIPFKVAVDRIIYQTDNPSAGKVRAAIYKEGPTSDSPDGGDLIVESASAAMASAYQVQYLTINETALEPGQYWLALQFSDATAAMRVVYEGSGATGHQFDNPGGYGSFPSSCPVTAGPTNIPVISLRVSKHFPIES